MVLTFADTHNMITFLTKSDASEGFEKIIDFLNASVIQYALVVNPTIYVSCIKQNWSSVSIKKTNDVVRLQALIDRRKVINTEASVRQALRLDDAESVDCLPNEEIFVELARMGYEKPSTKLTFYKALVRNVDSSSKFYMYRRFLQLMINAQIADLSSHNTKYTSPNLTQKVFANRRRVGKGFSEVDALLFEGMLVPHQVNDDVVDDVADDVVDDVVAIVADADAEPTLPLPTPATTPPHKQELIPSTSQEVAKDAEVQGRLEESQAQVYHLDLEHAQKVLSMQDDEAEPAELTKVIEVVITSKLMTKVVTAAATTAATTSTVAPMLTASAARRRKGVVIRDPEETATLSDEAYARELEAKLNANTNWNEVIEHVKRKEKQDNAVMRYQSLKRKPQTEAQARKNMMVYLKNMAGFKMDFLKGTSYDEIRPIFEKHFNSIVAFLEKDEKELEEEASKAIKRKSETSKDKAAKKQKLDEEVEELKTHLQIVPNDEDDVYTEATPLALKVSVVDYQIHTENNKPYYKIIRSDGTHQLFLSFIRFLGVDVVEDFKEYTLRDYYCWLKTYCYWYKLKLLYDAAGSRLRLLEESADADKKIKKLL
nr:hypothetical protein [Tanacetum cinerariifolium]